MTMPTMIPTRHLPVLLSICTLREAFDDAESHISVSMAAFSALACFVVARSALEKPNSHPSSFSSVTKQPLALSPWKTALSSLFI